MLDRLFNNVIDNKKEKSVCISLFSFCFVYGSRFSFSSFRLIA